jgi:hypothetical protein
MPERGVSRRVAVKFDEVGSDGRLNKAASERAALEPQAAEPAEPPVVEIETFRSAQLPSPSSNLAKAWE